MLALPLLRVQLIVQAMQLLSVILQSVASCAQCSYNAPPCVLSHEFAGLCRENREAIDKIVELLQEKETIDGKEFRAILSEFTTIPESVREQNKEPILA